MLKNLPPVFVSWPCEMFVKCLLFNDNGRGVSNVQGTTASRDVPAPGWKCTGWKSPFYCEQVRFNFYKKICLIFSD